MKTRLVYIDLLRAYAILLVTGFHLWRFFGRPKIEFMAYDLLAPLQRGWSGVEIFFIISGYSMALITYESYRSGINLDWKNYILKRLFRIVPAYYIAIAVWSVLIWNGVAPKPIGLIDQVSHLLFVHTFNPDTYYSISGVFWSLGIEMQFYLLLPLVLGVVVRYPIPALVFSAVPLLYSIFVHATFMLSKTLLGFILYFILGYVTFMLRDHLYRLLFSHGYSGLVLVIFSLAYLHLSFYRGVIYNGKLHVFISCLCFIPIFIYLYRLKALELSQNKILSVFVFTGTSSYSIYLYNYVFYIDKSPFAHNFEAVVFYFLLVYLAGMAMYFLVERPFQNLREKIIKRKYVVAGEYAQGFKKADGDLAKDNKSLVAV